MSVVFVRNGDANTGKTKLQNWVNSMRNGLGLDNSLTNPISDLSELKNPAYWAFFRSSPDLKVLTITSISCMNSLLSLEGA